MVPNYFFSFIVFVFSFQFSSSYSVNCLKDEDLSDVQNYAFTLPKVTSDASYWDDQQYSFYAYGKMDETKEADEATTISAKFLTAEGELIYSTTINCDEQTWKNMVTDPVTEEETESIAGELNSPCTNSENIIDIIFKVNNAYMMSWIFNGEALQTKTRTIEKLKVSKVDAAKKEVLVEDEGRTKVKRMNLGLYYTYIVRPFKVPTKSHAYMGAEVILKTTGKAVLTRIVFGQCSSWPKEYTMQCQKANAYVLDRSKKNTTAYIEEVQEKLLTEGMSESDIEAEINELKQSPDYNNRGIGVFGNIQPQFMPACFLDSNIFDHLTTYVHPDKFNVGSGGKKEAQMYICCTDMATGLIWDEENSKPEERAAISSKHCKRTSVGKESATDMICEVSRDDRLVLLAIKEKNQ